MAKFDCPHCGETVEVKVFLKDVTKTKTLGEGDFMTAALKSIEEAIGEKESPRTVASVATRIHKQATPPTSILGGQYSELMDKREKLLQGGVAIQKAAEQYDSDDNTYLSEDKVADGESIAAKMNNIFGGR